MIVAVALAAVSGGGGVKLLEFAWDRYKGRTQKRRAEVDRAAKVAAEQRARAELAERRVSELEREKRLLAESLHDHRTVMQLSGKWDRLSLPPWIKE